MKRLLIGTCLAVTCAVGLAAQAPTGTSKPQTPPTTPGGSQPTTAQKPASSDADSSVLRGCLRAGEQTGTFMLTDASATSGGTLKNAKVQLMGSPSGVNLKDHVGHTVEVTGTMARGGDSKSSGTGTTGTGAGAGTAAGTGAGTGTGTSKPGSSGAGAGATAGAASGAASGAATLNVKAMKHVKEGC